MLKQQTIQSTSSDVLPRPAEFSGAPMTYQQLIESGCAYLERESMGHQQVKNLASALRLWVELHGFAYERVVGDDFGSDFDRYFLRFADLLRDGRKLRTQKDRQEQILRWRRIAQMLRQQDTLPTNFSEALAHCLRVSPLTRSQVARDVGITVRQLESWSREGRQPRPDVVSVLPKLEDVLELPRGTLLTRLPLARRSHYERGRTARDRSTSFTKIRIAQRKATGTYAMAFEGRLANQWTDLLAFKTDSLREHARARNTWRLKSVDRVAIRIFPWMLMGSQVCPTASVQWGFISSYLGWLSLPRPIGLGMRKDEADTLAWLADPDKVIAYAKWQMSRSGHRFHNGVNVALQSVESYLRPQTGFVWLRPNLRSTVPEMKLLSSQGDSTSSSDETAQWQTHCARARQQIRGFRERAEDTLKIRPARDPQERIACVLQAEFPLKELVMFTQSLERSAPPPAHLRDYVSWIRDVTLCRMLISNPLRISQYAAMTFREDGTGNLVRVGPGRYRLRFAASDFKNEKGAANAPYDVEVDASVAPWIDRYLSEARPYMCDADATSRFFLTSVRGFQRQKPACLEERGLKEVAGPRATAFYIRIKHLTALHIPNCPGFGPHSYRHIVATDHLRRHPGDYLTVATLLHDKLETVLKSYGHLKVSDGLRVLSAGIREATEQLENAPRIN